MSNNSDVDQAIDDLRVEMEKAEVPAEKQDMLDDIAEHCDRLQDEQGRDYGLLQDKLEKAVLHFDAEHHQLVRSMQNVINSLSDAGV